MVSWIFLQGCARWLILAQGARLDSMTSKILLASARAMLFVGLLASSVFVVSKVAAQSAKGEREANSTGRALSPVSSAPHSKVSPYRPTTVPQHARNFYHVAW